MPGPRWTITFPLLQLTTRHQNIKLVSRHILHFTTYSVPLKELPLVFYQINISIEGMFYEDVRKDFLQFSCVICNISFLVCPRVQSIILQPSRDCSSSSSNYQLLTTAHNNYVERSTNLYEVSQRQEKAPTRNFTFLEVSNSAFG